MSDSVALADVIAVACAEAWRGDGEIFASGMGVMQMLGARVARATFEPDLMISDGEAFYVSGDLPIGGTQKLVEGWIPFRSVFDTLAGGRRHVMMGASQIDRYGNSNIANIGPWAKPKSQLLGVRGGPGNTVNNATSFTHEYRRHRCSTNWCHHIEWLCASRLRLHRLEPRFHACTANFFTRRCVHLR